MSPGNFRSHILYAMLSDHASIESSYLESSVSVPAVDFVYETVIACVNEMDGCGYLLVVIVLVRNLLRM